MDCPISTNIAIIVFYVLGIITDKNFISKKKYVPRTVYYRF